MSAPERMDEAPPPRASGLLRRALLAGLVIALSTAGAVYASVRLLEADLFPNEIAQDIPELERPEEGEPQTVMLIGSDRRAEDGVPPRSDTIMLVRLDPDAEELRVTSIPRDLLIDGRKINEAYATGGARGTVRAIRHLLSSPGRPFAINHVITANFTGFREAINDLGCVYVDVDRDYFNDRGGPGGYALIDIDPGYQKLCGKDSLAYVRYRHADSDVYRGARQQEFLRQLRRQPGAEAMMSYDYDNLRRVAALAKRTVEVDRQLRHRRELFRFAEAVMYSARHPVRNIPFPAEPEPGDPNDLVASRTDLRKTVDAFLGAEPERSAPTPRKRRRSPSAARERRARPELVDARRAGEDRAILAASRLDFPFYFPARVTKTAAYVGDAARTYRLRDTEGREHDAYRLVLSTNRVGEYYGVQGTTWRDPPILEEEHEKVRRRGRTLRVYGDRMVAWRTGKAVYWVSNTLGRSLSRDELVAVAASLSRFGR